MSLHSAFPICGVRLSVEGGDVISDEYRVTASESKSLVVECPRAALRYAPPAPGRFVILESQLPDAVYRLRARVDTGAPEETTVLRLTPAGPVNRIQRRRNFRVSENLPVTLGVSSAGGSRKLELMTADISAGGIRVRTQEAFDPGQQVEITVRFDEYAFALNCCGRVARCRQMGGGHFDVGIQFVEMNPRDQDRVVSILMKIMRNKIKL